MKKFTVLFSLLLVAGLVGQGLAWADGAGATCNMGKKCKCNFVPGNKKHLNKQVTK
jgi:hypothetical protein